MSSIRKIVITSIVTIGSVWGASAVAGERMPRSVVVSYDDLDVSSDRGAKVLYSRLRGASRSSCAAFDGDSLHAQRLMSNCVNEALSNAVADLQNEKLSALHARATGQFAAVSSGGGSMTASSR